MSHSPTNKEIVVELMRHLEAGELDAVLDSLHPDFVSHNPNVAHDPAQATGRHAFEAFLRSPAGAPLLGTKIDIGRVITDEDHVVVHSQFIREQPPRIAAVDILRIQDGKIIEHWDVLQPIPETLPHPHGMV